MKQHSEHKTHTIFPSTFCSGHKSVQSAPWIVYDSTTNSYKCYIYIRLSMEQHRDKIFNWRKNEQTGKKVLTQFRNGNPNELGLQKLKHWLRMSSRVCYIRECVRMREQEWMYVCVYESVFMLSKWKNQMVVSNSVLEPQCRTHCSLFKSLWYNFALNIQYAHSRAVRKSTTDENFFRGSHVSFGHGCRHHFTRDNF